ncbi:MAG: carbohydrate ABC transporter permease [Culicoidibacterales bacterium]
MKQLSKQDKIKQIAKNNKQLDGKTVVKSSTKHILLIVVGITMIMPFLWMISTSLKTTSNVFVIPPQWIPSPAVWQNYPLIFEKIPFLRYLLNTGGMAIGKLFGDIFVSALVAYGFAKFNFKFKKGLFLFLLATIMLPGEVTLVPTYIMWSKLGSFVSSLGAGNFSFINTYIPLMLPTLGGQAVFVFFLVQYFQTISKEFYEAAYMDGANSFAIFLKIYLPLSIPAIVTISIQSFMGSWNDFLAPLIYLNDQELFTVQIGLAMFQGLNGTNWPLLMGATTLSIIPVLIVFFSMQRYFVRSNKADGIK